VSLLEAVSLLDVVVAVTYSGGVAVGPSEVLLEDVLVALEVTGARTIVKGPK